MKGDIYREEREKNNFTQEALSGEIDLSVTSIKAYETGKTIPTTKTVIKMCEAYKDYTLYYKHLQEQDLLCLLPKHEGVGVQGATLTLISNLENIQEEIPNLIRIVKDGTIENHEADEYKEILKTITDIFKPIIELIYVPS